MNLPPSRQPGAMTLRRCLRVTTVPVLATALLSLALAAMLPPVVADPTAASGAGTPWLQLPMFTAAAGCGLTALAFWPLFAARRPGADWARRLQRGPLQGCGAALAGALLAQLLLTLPLTTLLARGLGAPATAAVHHALPPVQPQPVLAPGQPRLDFVLPATAGHDYAELHLRPLAAMPVAEFRSSRVEVYADGERLSASDPVWSQTGQFVRLPFAPRPIHRLELRLAEGTVPLFFPTGSVELVEARGRSAWANGALLALVALLPTFLALALACLGGTAAALPTLATLLVGCQWVLTVGGIGPFDSALQQVLRGRWLGSTAVFPQCIPSLVLGSVAMILAMLLRRRSRR